MSHIMAYIPGVEIIYSLIRDMLASFVGDRCKFTNLVWVRINGTPEIWCIGFSTQHTMNSTNLEGMVSVCLPHSYAISGQVIVISAENIEPAEGSTTQKAMKSTLSGGIFKSNK